MGLYRLNYKKSDLSDGVLEKANKHDINYERDFENWLENSPHVLLDSDDDLNVLWIGRQVTAVYADRYKFPDLLGVDADGNVVIAELKKGKTSREVIAQILEYASWAEKLTYSDLNNITMKYFEQKSEYIGQELSEIHQKVFYSDADDDSEIQFNQKLRLFIVAEEISATVKDIVFFLNQYGLEINCLKYDVFSNDIGEFYVSTEIEEAMNKSSTRKQNGSVSRWQGEETIREVVKRVVDEIVSKSNNGIFSTKEIMQKVLAEYPNFNKSSIRCQLYSDCVNHSSRKHYKSGQRDYYYQVEGTKYRLYNKNIDGKWDSNGQKQ